MNAQDAARLLAEIENERRNLDHAAAEIDSRRAATDDTTSYALALLLMNYYTGAERIFQRIAALLGGLPPAERLAGLLRFRHAIRNLYAWTIRRAEMDIHIAALPEHHHRLTADLERFGSFLRRLVAG